MLEQIDEATKKYLLQWQGLVEQRRDQDFFRSLLPVAVGWKVADQAEYSKAYADLREQCDRIVETWMNGRWIAKMHVKDAALNGGIEIIKLMQRRPGSDDALGLDHVDFYSPAVANAENILKTESDLKWTHESNEVVENYNWISIWFEGTEAKLKASTVLDIVVAELLEIKQKIISK